MYSFINGHIRGVDHCYADMLNFIFVIFDRHEGAVLVHIFNSAGNRTVVAEFEEIRPLFPAGEGEVFKDNDAFDFVFYKFARQIGKAFKQVSADYSAGGLPAV